MCRGSRSVPSCAGPGRRRYSSSDGSRAASHRSVRFSHLNVEHAASQTSWTPSKLRIVRDRDAMDPSDHQRRRNLRYKNLTSRRSESSPHSRRTAHRRNASHSFSRTDFRRPHRERVRGARRLPSRAGLHTACGRPLRLHRTSHLSARDAPHVTIPDEHTCTAGYTGTRRCCARAASRYLRIEDVRY